MASGAVLVVEANRTPVPAVKKAKDTLTRNQTRLLGVVLNKYRQKGGDETYVGGGAEYGGPG
jgi:Mrp family chromosome partitioning ATPase